MNGAPRMPEAGFIGVFSLVVVLDVVRQDATMKWLADAVSKSSLGVRTKIRIVGERWLNLASVMLFAAAVLPLSPALMFGRFL